MQREKKERYADEVYNIFLSEVVTPLTGDQTTYLDELEGVGYKMLGVKFAGVFPSDKIPKLNDLKKYAILNLDNSKQPGSHWIAIAKEGNLTYVYDSFGRCSSEIIADLHYSGNGRIIDTDPDAEQQIRETNCGARSLAWLLTFELLGSDFARLV